MRACFIIIWCIEALSPAPSLPPHLTLGSLERTCGGRGRGGGDAGDRLLSQGRGGRRWGGHCEGAQQGGWAHAFRHAGDMAQTSPETMAYYMVWSIGVKPKEQAADEEGSHLTQHTNRMQGSKGWFTLFRLR